MKIGLGTVQFGTDYGINNDGGQVNVTEIKAILDYAKNVGVDTIDTAVTYGSSEQSLGEVGVDSYMVVTKLPEVPDGVKNIEKWVKNHVINSLSHLRVNSLSGLLLHRPMQLLDSTKKDLWPVLLQLKKEGVVKKIGFSIYSPYELDELWDLFKQDLVQAQHNVLDRRLETSGWLQRMCDENVELHIRSIFLQGLLLMNEDTRPEKFNQWSDIWRCWATWLKDNDITPLQAAVAFALSDSRISRVIIGVDSVDHLKEIIKAANNNGHFPEMPDVADTRLLNPSEWFLL